MKTIGREILWNLPHAAAVIMYALFGVVLLVIAWGVYRRVESYRLGRAERENRFDDLRGRLWDTVRLALGQERVLHRKFGGLVHLCIFSAFIVLFIVTCLVAVEYDLGFRILDGNFYIVFKLFAETFGALLLLGVAGALLRRIAFRPPGLTKENDDTLQLLLIGAIGVTGFRRSPRSPSSATPSRRPSSGGCLSRRSCPPTRRSGGPTC
jgi:nitrate reductase gamma subunit